ACLRGALWQSSLELLSLSANPDELTFGCAALALAAQGGPSATAQAQAIALYREACDRGVLSHWSTSHAGVVDLHRLPVEVAKLAVCTVLLDTLTGVGPTGSSAGAGDLKIVVGRGNHSEGGLAKVGPAVVEFLRDELGLPVRQAPHGAGALHIPGALLVPFEGLRSWMNDRRNDCE
ncbi:unnamed protein product, partial [Polarella glacialis]